MLFLLQTYIGDILLAVNPYKSLNLYNTEVWSIILWFGNFCNLKTSLVVALFLQPAFLKIKYASW